MSPLRKALLTFLLIFLPINSSLCIDMYLPAYPEIAQSFAVKEGDINLSMSLYLIGLALGQLIYGPLADRFGRKRVLMVGLLIFVISSFACTLTRNLDIFLLARLFQALGACSCIVISRAIVTDIYPPKQRGTILAFISAANIFSPALAPLFGGYLVQWFSWLAIFEVIALVGVFMLVATLFLLPETLKNPDYQALQFKHMANNLYRLFSYPMFVGYSLGIALLFALAFIWVTYSPNILLNEFQIPPDQFGLFFLVPATGSTIGALLTAFCGARVGEKRFIGLGYTLVLLGVAILLSLMLRNYIDTPFKVIMPIMLIFLGINMAQPLQVASALAPFTDIAGFTAGIIGFIQISAGACVALLTSSWYQAGNDTMAFLMLSAAVLAFLGFGYAVRASLARDTSY
ncbi:MAG: multidrug effflux MFS transporter [Gammaproteobacteria bacterium]